jgi:hypothetical protein
MRDGNYNSIDTTIMKEKILDLLCKKVHWLDEDYTIGGIIVTMSGCVLFILLCGLLEGLS